MGGCWAVDRVPLWLASGVVGLDVVDKMVCHQLYFAVVYLPSGIGQTVPAAVAAVSRL